MQQIKSFKNAQETAIALANHIREQVPHARDKFYLAVSGGSTPKMLFEALVNVKDQLQWEKVQLFWVDERCVPPTDDESNYKMTLNALLKHISLPEENIHRMKGELNPKEGLADYENQIKLVPVNEGYPRFDLIILGMGDDGHTASIFPSEKHLLDMESMLAIGTNPYSNQKRLTLTGKTIKNAKEIIFHVTGKAKANVFDKIINQKEKYLEYPAYYIANNTKTTWYLDEAVQNYIN